MEAPLEDALPEAETSAGPAIGRDEWVARAAERRTRRSGWLGAVEERVRAAPWWAWLALFAGVIALLPVGFESGYVRRVAFDTVLYMLLALGLNVVVGWGGLLDLGYVAFYGVGAYTYALLGSDKFDIHVPTILLVPLVVVVGAVVGFLVGLPSRRLVGDYLAIVTLFFLQIFLTIGLNGDDLFGLGNVTGGPNGILRVDPLSFFGHELPVQHGGVFAVSYLYVALGLFVLVYVALRFVNESRTGRAWRSLREDPLAAELMGMPVNWLKLMSFASGAAVAALTGTIFAALNASVFPLTFSFPLLITIYTMVILGGSGSMPGVVVGAALISVLLELLREPGDARVLFYAVVALGLVAAFRWSRRLAVVFAATVALGFAVHAVADAIDTTWAAGVTQDGREVPAWAADWVVVPSHLAGWIAPVSYIGLIGLVLGLTLVRGWARLALIPPVLYLAAFVWENVMLAKPEPTRYIVLGALLIALMILRPNGLFGERRVEIV
ncbi:MAG TPA: branched-chain amino acid ABC transporter permease [Gaiellaceae bacterium]|nr:branched-chain amino acid ABC transporter permease [Gaiellaceae bacterium]